MHKTSAINTSGDAERLYLQQLRQLYNHVLAGLDSLKGEEYNRTKRNLARQARFYKCISGRSITESGDRRG